MTTLLSFRSTATILIWLASIQLSSADITESEYLELALNEETSISIAQYGNAENRILWIPSEYGINKENMMTY